jgi:hypothetical protein
MNLFPLSRSALLWHIATVGFRKRVSNAAFSFFDSERAQDTHRKWLARFILMKRSLRTIVVSLSIFTAVTAPDVAEGGPFRDFFRAVRSAITHPNEKPRPHRSSRKHNETPPSDAPHSEISASSAPAPRSGRNVRAAKTSSGTKQGNTDLPYGTPVPGKQGFVTSPFAPESGYVDVRSFPPGTEVKDPYSGKVFLTP